MRTRLLLLPSLLLVGLGAVPVDAAQKTTGEQRQLELLGGMSREQQLAAPNQLFLQSYVRRGALLYLHRLDGLACSDLFSLGDEVLFAGAFGNTDGSEHNLVFLEGAGSPSHLDSGPYRFPADTWRGLWPLGPDLNTFWHEVSHALLDAAGLGIAEAPYAASLDDPDEGAGMRSRTALTSSDEHHPFIEGVGQRNSEAYGLLFAFEEAVRRADRAESEYLAEGRAIDHSVERQLWGEAHMRFSAFLKAMKRVANMPPEALGAYRQATGVFFSTAEQVAELYRSGGMKRLQRGEALGIRPPAWVFFPDLMRMPLQLVLRDAEGRDLEQPGIASTAKFQIKDGIYRQELSVEVRARGSAARLTRSALKNQEIGGLVARGTLRIRLVEDEPLVTLSVRQGGQSTGGVAAPGGPSQQLFDLDLSAKDPQPVRVVFVRRKLPELREPTTYHVEFSFADKGKDPIYDTATAQASFALGPGAAAAKAPASTATAQPPAQPPPSTSALAPAQGKQKTGEKLGLTFGWGPLPEGFRGTTGFMSGDQYGPHNPLPAKGERELVTGPVLFFEKGKWGTNGIVVELFVNRRDASWALRNHVEELSKNNPMFANLFEHREGQVGGRRAFVSRMRANGGQKVNWVYSVELDPKRALWASILSDLDVNDKHKGVAAAIERQHEQLIASLRFGPDASPLA
ncbi:MAG TPA: hypothetical protein DFS52_02715, partial [Myxococcales bacterium]|nr:hypothetical protein [Myxococcales bacterium]